jgi:hypothetical protein
MDFSRSIPLVIVNYDEKKTRNAVWILHGYKPPGDPYLQDPAIIVKNWGLEKLSMATHDMFYLPDMGTTVYPMNTLAPVSDIEVLSNLVYYFKKKSQPEELIFAGISTGSEGAVKLASKYGGGATVVCISGTFDYSGLDPSAGEYKIHEKVFGDLKTAWKSENPVDIMMTMKKTRVYVFSEENSIFHEQARSIIKKGLTNIDIIDETKAGSGFSHNWGFWKSKAILSSLAEIFAGN